MGRVNGQKIHLVIVTQWFPPEQAPIGTMQLELAQEMQKRGFDVTIITGFPNHPSGQVFPGYAKRWSLKEEVGSVAVRRTWLYTSPGRTRMTRLLTFLTFTLTSSWALARVRRVDVIFAVLQPLSLGVALAAVAKLRGARLVLNVQDLHPDVPISLGLVKNRLAIRFLRWIERFAYRSADALAVICDGFREHVRRCLVRDKPVTVIPNWIDVDFVRPSNRMNGFRAEAGATGADFVVLYAGTIGYVSGAHVLVEAARLLSSNERIRIVFVGEGPVVPVLERLVEEFGLTNVTFFPFQPRERLNEVQASCDLAVVSLASGKGGYSVPSKVLGYMAAGRPVAASVDSECETARFIRRSGGGVVVDSESAEQLARVIRQLSADRDECHAMGTRGRQFVENYHSKPVVTESYAALIGSVSRL